MGRIILKEKFKKFGKKMEKRKKIGKTEKFWKKI